jgi:methylated-DNA-[protein]-cysteine S-methyltransferase
MSPVSLSPEGAQTLIDTPLGRMRLAATARGLSGAWFEGQRHHPGELTLPHDAAHPWLALARQQLAEYWAQPQRTAFAVPLDVTGTAFQQAVWAALRQIPLGHTWRYAELAAHIGRPTAVRAVGAAIGRNPVSVIVPCHRVLGRTGSLTGYAGGLDRKRALLAAEGVKVTA